MCLLLQYIFLTISIYQFYNATLNFCFIVYFLKHKTKLKKKRNQLIKTCVFTKTQKQKNIVQNETRLCRIRKIIKKRITNLSINANETNQLPIESNPPNRNEFE